MPKILVLEDEDYIRVKIKKLLTDNNYDVSEARQGQEALHLLEKENFDLLIMDLVMPVKGGLETLMELKSEIKNTLKVIIVSGKAPSYSDAFMLLIKQFGVHKLIHKPFRKQELLDSIRELLTKKTD